MTVPTTTERINAQGGLILVGQIMKKACALPDLLSSLKSPPNQRYSPSDILKGSF